MIWRRARPDGRNWSDRVRDGAVEVFEPGEPLSMQPHRYGLNIHSIVLFNFLPGPAAATLRFRLPAGVRRLDLALAAGGGSRVAPSAVGPDSDRLFGSCREIHLTVSPAAAATWFLAGDEMHVLLMGERWRDELPETVRRYGLADPRLLLPPYRLHRDRAFPDHGEQEKLHGHLLARSAADGARLFDPSFALPEERRIPPSIHWIWLRNPGDPAVPISPLRRIHLLRMRSWAARNPAFGLHLWTDGDLDLLLPRRAERKLYQRLFGDRLRVHGPGEARTLLASCPLANRDLLADVFEHAACTAVRSDLLRLVILATQGGIYGDLNDTECLVPLAPVCERSSFFLGIDRFNRAHNAVLASAPGHPLLLAVLEQLRVGSEEINRELAAAATIEDYFFVVLKACGPYALTRCLAERLGGLDADTLLLPFPYLHNPHGWRQTPLSLVHHHSAMSWIHAERKKRGMQSRILGVLLERFSWLGF